MDALFPMVDGCVCVCGGGGREGKKLMMIQFSADGLGMITRKEEGLRTNPYERQSIRQVPGTVQ